VNFGRFRRNQSFSHGEELNSWGESGKNRFFARFLASPSLHKGEKA
jgi:hypothetical protein